MKMSVSAAGSPNQQMRREGRLWETAVTQSVARIGDSIKKRWRGQVRAAGLGNRLAGSIRAETYPKGSVSASAAAFVFTRADDIIMGHDEGSLIRSENGFWLAIPTEAAGKSGGRRPNPLQWERRNNTPLRFVFRPGGKGLLVAEVGVTKKGIARGRKRTRLKSGKFAKNIQTVPIFVLVPQVQLPKRLDLQAAAAQEAASIDRLIVSTYNRLD